MRMLASESCRKIASAFRERRERAAIAELDKCPARLKDEFASLEFAELLNHFRSPGRPAFLPCDLATIARCQSRLLTGDTERLVAEAALIVRDKKWRLLGFGEMEFTGNDSWRRDPLSGVDWGLEYHRDVELARKDGSDVRVLWELNRFGHALTLARAFAITRDEVFAGEFFSQIQTWRTQNPYGRGANWSCAMDVALRAVNVLVGLEILRDSQELDEHIFAELLRFFDQHGRFIADNNEFSYIRTSNHYLTNVAGLLWIGVLVPELSNAGKWRDWGLRGILREMDAQILPDGANFESSTGYHRYVAEVFLYSFLLCRRNGIDIPARFLEKLRSMIEYVRHYIRPDRFAPLIGDADGGRFLPFTVRSADDHEYLLAVAAEFFNEPELLTAEAAGEAVWSTGAVLFEQRANLPVPTLPGSAAFPATGAYVQRKETLYLYFNAQDCGLRGRGSHSHNDKLSVEISAFESPFIADAGTYAYGFDLDARHRFRSTASHSTVEVDDSEQNSIDRDIPFVIGNEARPVVLDWMIDDNRDFVSAEHHGYARLESPVSHRRSVRFDKEREFWIIDDELFGNGEHRLTFRFQLSPDVRVGSTDNFIELLDRRENRLFIKILGTQTAPILSPSWVSRDYGSRTEAVLLSWTVETRLPFKARFVIVPVGRDKSTDKLDAISRLADEQK